MLHAECLRFKSRASVRLVLTNRERWLTHALGRGCSLGRGSSVEGAGVPIERTVV